MKQNQEFLGQEAAEEGADAGEMEFQPVEQNIE